MSNDEREFLNCPVSKGGKIVVTHSNWGRSEMVKHYEYRIHKMKYSNDLSGELYVGEAIVKTIPGNRYWDLMMAGK